MSVLRPRRAGAREPEPDGMSRVRIWRLFGPSSCWLYRSLFGFRGRDNTRLSRCVCERQARELTLQDKRSVSRPRHKWLADHLMSVYVCFVELGNSTFNVEFHALSIHLSVLTLVGLVHLN
jgi:hypothetical protein